MIIEDKQIDDDASYASKLSLDPHCGHLTIHSSYNSTSDLKLNHPYTHLFNDDPRKPATQDL